MEKNVLFFIPTLSGGGAERAVSNISKNLSRDINQEILLFGETAKVEYPHSARITYLDRLPHSNIANKLFGFIWRLKEVRKIFGKRVNTTVVSFLEYPNLLNTLTRKRGKTIVSVRNHMSTQHSDGIKSYLWNKTIKELYSKANLVVAVSEEIKRDLVENYSIPQDKVKVIYNSYPVIVLRHYQINRLIPNTKICLTIQL